MQTQKPMQQILGPANSGNGELCTTSYRKAFWAIVTSLQHHREPVKAVHFTNAITQVMISTQWYKLFSLQQQMNRTLNMQEHPP